MSAPIIFRKRGKRQVSAEREFRCDVTSASTKLLCHWTTVSISSGKPSPQWLSSTFLPLLQPFFTTPSFPLEILDRSDIS